MKQWVLTLGFITLLTKKNFAMKRLIVLVFVAGGM